VTHRKYRGHPQSMGQPQLWIRHIRMCIEDFTCVFSIVRLCIEDFLCVSSIFGVDPPIHVGDFSISQSSAVIVNSKGGSHLEDFGWVESRKSQSIRKTKDLAVRYDDRVGCKVHYKVFHH